MTNIRLLSISVATGVPRSIKSPSLISMSSINASIGAVILIVSIASSAARTWARATSRLAAADSRLPFDCKPCFCSFRAALYSLPACTRLARATARSASRVPTERVASTWPRPIRWPLLKCSCLTLPVASERNVSTVSGST